MILLLYGTDRVTIDERIRALRDEHDPAQLNTTVIDRASERLADLRSAVGAPAFFGGSRLVIAHHLISKRPGSRGRAKASEEDPLSVLATVPDTTILALVEDMVEPASERAVRQVAPGVRVERHDVPRGHDLVEWSCARARRYDAVLPADAAAHLLEALFPGRWQAAARRDDQPPDLYRLDGEIAKLAVAAGPEGRITGELVGMLVPGADAQNLWGLTDAIAAGDPAAAVRELERALDNGTPAELLIGQLTGQFEAFAALTAGTSDLATIAAQTGLTEGRLRQVARSARSFPVARVRDALALLRAVDFDAKQGRAEAEEALVGIVTLLASRR